MTVGTVIELFLLFCIEFIMIYDYTFVKSKFWENSEIDECDNY